MRAGEDGGIDTFTIRNVLPNEDDRFFQGLLPDVSMIGTKMLIKSVAGLGWGSEVARE